MDHASRLGAEAVTEAEREAIRAVVEHGSTKRAARALHLSRGAVLSRLNRLRKKLGLPYMPQLAGYAALAGWLRIAAAETTTAAPGAGTSSARATGAEGRLLLPAQATCWICGRPLRRDYRNRRTVQTVRGVLCLTVQIALCAGAGCPRNARPYHPEAEGALAFEHTSLGTDLLALAAALHDRHSFDNVHRELQGAGA